MTVDISSLALAAVAVAGIEQAYVVDRDGKLWHVVGWRVGVATLCDTPDGVAIKAVSCLWESSTFSLAAVDVNGRLWFGHTGWRSSSHELTWRRA